VGDFRVADFRTVEAQVDKLTQWRCAAQVAAFERTLPGMPMMTPNEHANRVFAYREEQNCLSHLLSNYW
jgi:hypothetical protein